MLADSDDLDPKLLPCIFHRNQEVKGGGLAMEIFPLTLVLLLMHGCPLAHAAMRARRDVTDPGPLSLTVQFLTQTSPGECYGGNAGLGDVTLRLEFRTNSTNFQWEEIENGIAPSDMYSGTVNAGCECVEFRLVQEEHGGGQCNCWRVGTVMVGTNTVNHRVGSEVTCCRRGK